MDWTLAYFQKKKNDWEKLAEEVEDKEDGLSCYAYKQVEMWKHFEEKAQELFHNAVQQKN